MPGDAPEPAFKGAFGDQSFAVEEITMRRRINIGAALIMFCATFVCGVDARAAGGYWNNSGFSISHEFFPGLHSSYSYNDYAPSYYGFNRFYFGEPHPDRATTEDAPAPITWAKRCRSSCLDLSGK